MNNRTFSAILLLLTFLSTGTQGQVSYIITQMGWSGPSWQRLTMLILLFAVIILAFVIAIMRRNYREVTGTKTNSERLFKEAVTRCGLLDREREAVEKLLQYEPQVQKQTIFQSISLFERCVSAEVDTLLLPATTQEERDIIGPLISTVRKKLGYSVIPLEHPLISTRNMSIGQTGSLFGRSHRTPVIHRASVVANNEFMLRLQYNTQKEEPVRFTPGTELKFAFARQNDGFYGISLTVAEYDGAGLISFRHTMELKRNQLRQYVRIDISTPLRMRMLKAVNPDKSDLKRGQMAEAKLCDVSGGGLCFLHTEPMKPGDILSLSFSLGQYSFSGIAGKILRAGLQEGKTVTLYKHHIEFVNIEQKKREQIVRFVFDKQRQLSQWR